MCNKYLPTIRDLEQNGRFIEAFPVGRHNEADEVVYWFPPTGRAYAIARWSDNEDQDIIPISTRVMPTHRRGDIEIRDLGNAELLEINNRLVLAYSEEIDEAITILRDEGLEKAVEYCCDVWSDGEEEQQWFANWLLEISKRVSDNNTDSSGYTSSRE